MPQSIAIRGAGVVGLWQALLLARRGHAVTLCERSPQPFAEACSLYAGAMLAPRCEEESAESVIRELGRRGVALWREIYPGTRANGTLVVALHRDRTELDRFARMTGGHQHLSPAELAAIEPVLSDRFAGALLYEEEAHLAPEPALRFLLDAVIAEGVALRLG
ncbi:MAG: FAD-binding oxidoreductase, partial [Methyloceanibacter sp.]|nr:FAD-binding oxidoreductase [Methyloceanibacter sp.]